MPPSAADESQLHCEPVPSSQCRQALEVLFADLSAADRPALIDDCLQPIAAGRAEWPAEVWQARRGEKISAVGMMRQQAGRVMYLWPPRAASGENADSAGSLVRAMVGSLHHRGLSMLQSLTEDRSSPAAAALQAGGLQHLAQLNYLAAFSCDFPEEPPPNCLTWETYRSEQRQQWAQVIEDTYLDTLDSPELNGLRSMDDLLDGYQATGHFDPQRWFLISDGKQPLGCLLLNDHPAQQQWELVYLGLVPSARRQGWGRLLVRQAQWLCRLARVPRLVLAVDARNAPALRLYEETGFLAWDTRQVWIRRLENESRSEPDV